MQRRRSARPSPTHGSADRYSDRRWAATVRHLAGGAATFVALATLTDWGTGGLTPLHAALWASLGGVGFAILVPQRVSAGEGWLEVRELLRRRRVRTEDLVTVQRSGSIAVRVILHDAHGDWVALDLRVLADNPLLWHRLDTDARRARRSGVLREGANVLGELESWISDEQARAVFRRSGL